MLPTLGLQKPIVWTRVSYQAVVRCFGYISCHTQTYTCANFVSPFLLLASTHKSDCHPIEDVSAVLDELCTITDWKMLGEELQVPHQILHNIDSNNPKAERGGNHPYMVQYYRKALLGNGGQSIEKNVVKETCMNSWKAWSKLQWSNLSFCSSNDCSSIAGQEILFGVDFNVLVELCLSFLY